jgi:methionine synthase I (cobalamin-dependent)
MSLTLIPDIEKVCADYLRAHADVVALNTRIRVTTPPDKSTSWVLITKIDAPQVNHPDHLVQFMVQFDCYAGATGGVPEVNTLERTVRAVLGTLPNAGVQILGGPRQVDTGMEPARDRVILTAYIWAHA